MVPRTSPDDEELQKLSADFMLASMKCYVNALKKRSKVFCLFLFISSLTIGHNVIGELKGTGFPDEIITVGGHLDSWDVNEGAHDDGAGVVQTIEVLRAFKALGFRPKHTIRKRNDQSDQISP